MINDFPTIQFDRGEFTLIDGDFIKVPAAYREKKIQAFTYYKKIFSKGDNERVLIGIDPIGFNYVYFKRLCYIGLVICDNKRILPPTKIRNRYPESQFNEKFLENHIRKDAKFRKFEEFVPIEVVSNNIHELRNLNSKISSNIDALLAVENEGEWETKFEAANSNIKKIYVGSRLIKFILDNLKFYNPNYIDLLKIDYKRSFIVHKSVLKIVKIFQNDFKKKKSNISLTGNSHRALNGEKELFEIILMLLIENAVKYSADLHNLPPKVNIKESDNTIELKISSWGPLIETDEREKIFDAGFRSRKQANIIGTGMGLFNAKKLAKLFDATIFYDAEATNIRSGWNNFYLICRTRAFDNLSNGVL